MLRTISIVASMTLAVSVANAEPMKLTDTQMDTVTAGAGLKLKNLNAPAANGGNPPWSALIAAGLPPTTVEAGPTGIELLLPR